LAGEFVHARFAGVLVAVFNSAGKNILAKPELQDKSLDCREFFS